MERSELLCLLIEYFLFSPSSKKRLFWSSCLYRSGREMILTREFIEQTQEKCQVRRGRWGDEKVLGSRARLMYGKKHQKLFRPSLKGILHGDARFRSVKSISIIIFESSSLEDVAVAAENLRAACCRRHLEIFYLWEFVDNDALVRLRLSTWSLAE